MVGCQVGLGGHVVLGHGRELLVSTSASGKRYGAAADVIAKVRAVKIGKDTEKILKNGKLTQEQRRQIRTQEISSKIAALKGAKARRVRERYEKERDMAEGPGDASQEEEEEEREEERQAAAEGAQPSSEGAPSEKIGEGVQAWAWERTGADDLRRSVARPRGPRGGGTVSEEAQAVYATLALGGGTASAAALLEVAGEFEGAGQLREVAELCECARGRIDREQIARKIGLAEAIALERECMWRLAGAYEGLGRLTSACEAYRMLMERPAPDPDGEAVRVQAKQRWVEVSVRLATRLEKKRRFEESADVYQLILNTTTRGISGDILYEEIQLLLAMSLQKIGRVEEAKELANDVAANTVCPTRRAQANWICDVFEVELEDERNDAFHEVWEQHFKLPEDSLRGGRRFGIGGSTSGRLGNLTPRQLAQKTWIRKYWEERLSGPVYYSFLVLFVTWPFAIPVVALMNKAVV